MKSQHPFNIPKSDQNSFKIPKSDQSPFKNRPKFFRNSEILSGILKFGVMSYKILLQNFKIKSDPQTVEIVLAEYSRMPNYLVGHNK